MEKSQCLWLDFGCREDDFFLTRLAPQYHHAREMVQFLKRLFGLQIETGKLYRLQPLSLPDIFQPHLKQVQLFDPSRLGIDKTEHSGRVAQADCLLIEGIVFIFNLI